MPPNPDSYVSPQPFIESGKATIPELYEWHAQENPSYHIFRYRNGQSTEGINYAQMNKGIIRAARQVVSFVGPATHSQHVIAILANAGSSFHATSLPSSCRTHFAPFYRTDSITYATILLGVLRAGHTAFPISSRNSAAAVVDLLSKTGCSHVFVSPDPRIRDLAGEVLTIVRGVSQYAIP